MVRFIIQFSGYHENGYKTDKQYQILNIEGDINMETVKKELEKLAELSPFRGKKEIDIFYMQAF
tara:strand:+ start:1498 stop:1689 length:192 start_codon:yes stop_codon:yes gene_type:complete